MVMFKTGNRSTDEILSAPNRIATRGKTHTELVAERQAKQQAQQQQQAMKVEADNMLAEQETDMKIQESIDINKDIDSGIIAKIANTDKGEGANYTSPGSQHSPRYIAEDVGPIENYSPMMQQEISREKVKEKYGSNEIGSTSKFDVFDMEGNVLRGGYNPGFARTLLQGFDNTGYDLARGINGSIMLGKDFFNADPQSIAETQAITTGLNDLQLEQSALSTPLLVRDNITGKVEQKTYGDIASDVEKSGISVLEGMPENIAVTVLAILSGGTSVAGYYGTKVTLNEYAKLREEGYDPGIALVGAGAKGGIEALGTQLTAGLLGKGGKVLGKVAGKAVAGSVIEGAEETIQGAASQSVDKYLLDKDVGVWDGAMGNLVGGAIAGPIIEGTSRLAGGAKAKLESKARNKAKVESDRQAEIATKKAQSEAEIEAEKAKIDEINNSWEPYNAGQMINMVKNKITGEVLHKDIVEPITTLEGVTDVNMKPILVDKVMDVKVDKVNREAPTISKAVTKQVAKIDTDDTTLKQTIKAKASKTNTVGKGKAKSKSINEATVKQVPEVKVTKENRFNEYVKVADAQKKDPNIEIPDDLDIADNGIKYAKLEDYRNNNREDNNGNVPTTPKEIKADILKSVEVTKAPKIEQKGARLIEDVYPDMHESTNFRIHHDPKNNIAVVETKDKKNPTKLFFNNVTTETIEQMKKDDTIGEALHAEYIGKAKALAPSKFHEVMGGVSPITDNQKSEIRYVDNMTKGKNLTTDGGKLSPEAITQLDKMDKVTVGKLIVSSKTDKSYTTKDTELLENYYDNRRARRPIDRSGADKHDKDGKPPAPKSGKEVRDILSKSNTDVSRDLKAKDGTNLQRHVDNLIEVTKSKYYNAKSAMGKQAKVLYNKIKDLALKLGGEFADIVNDFYWNTNTGIAMGVIQDPKGRKAAPWDNVSESVKKDYVATDKPIPKAEKPKTIDRTLDEELKRVDTVLENDDLEKLLSPRDKNLLTGWKTYLTNNYSVNLKAFDATGKFEGVEPKMSKMLDAIEDANLREVSTLMNEERDGYMEERSKELGKLTEAIHDESIAGRYTSISEYLNIGKVFSKYSDSKVNTGNMFIPPVYHTRKMGDLFKAHTYDAIVTSRNKELTIKYTVADYVNNKLAYDKDLKKTFKDNNVMDIVKIIGDKVTVDKGYKSEYKLDKLEATLDDLIPISLFNIAHNRNKVDDTYTFTMGPVEGDGYITLTGQQVKAIRVKIRELAKDNPALTGYINAIKKGSIDIGNIKNADESISMVTGRESSGFLVDGYPIPMTAKQTDPNDSHKPTLENSTAKSFRNNYDKTSILPENRVYRLAPSSLMFNNLVDKVANITAYDKTIATLNQLRENKNVVDAINKTLGPGNGKEMINWMGYMIERYESPKSFTDEFLETRFAKVSGNFYTATLGFNPGLMVVQAASATLSAERLSTLSGENYAKVLVLVNKNTATEGARRLKNGTSKIKNNGKKTLYDETRDRISIDYMPMNYERGSDGATHEMRIISAREDKSRTGVGEKRTKSEKAGDFVRWLRKKSMAGITYGDMSTIDGITATAMSLQITKMKKNNQVVPRPILEYVRARASVGKVPTKVLTNLNEYLDKQEKSSDGFFLEVGKIVDDVVGVSQPASEAMNTTNIRKSKNPLIQYATMFTSQTAQTAGMIMDKTDKIVESLQKKEISTLEAFGSLGKLGIGTLISSAIFAFIKELQDDITKPETQMKYDETNVLNRTRDALLGINQISSMVNTGYKMASSNDRFRKDIDMLPPQMSLIKDAATSGYDIFNQAIKNDMDFGEVDVKYYLKFANAMTEANVGISPKGILKYVAPVTKPVKTTYQIEALWDIEHGTDDESRQKAYIKYLNTLYSKTPDGEKYNDDRKAIAKALGPATAKLTRIQNKKLKNK